jgi:hypothetical protein
MTTAGVEAGFVVAIVPMIAFRVEPHATTGGVKVAQQSDLSLTRHVDRQVLDPRLPNWLRIELH